MGTKVFKIGFKILEPVPPDIKKVPGATMEIYSYVESGKQEAAIARFRKDLVRRGITKMEFISCVRK